MFLDLVCDNNYINVNIQLAKLTDLQTATYFAELLNIMREVNRKKKFDQTTGYFKLDRKYVEERTTLPVEEQLTCDEVLTKLGILDTSQDIKNMIRVDVQRYCTLITAEKVTAVKSTRATKETTPKNSKEGQIIGMKAVVDELVTDETLRNAMHDWVDAIYANKRYLTKKMIELFLDTISTFTYDPVEQLDIIRQATASGYSNANWVTDKYKRRASATTLSTPQKTATEISSETF